LRDFTVTLTGLAVVEYVVEYPEVATAEVDDGVLPLATARQLTFPAISLVVSKATINVTLLVLIVPVLTSISGTTVLVSIVGCSVGEKDGDQSARITDGTLAAADVYPSFWSSDVNVPLAIALFIADIICSALPTLDPTILYETVTSVTASVVSIERLLVGDVPAQDMEVIKMSSVDTPVIEDRIVSIVVEKDSVLASEQLIPLITCHDIRIIYISVEHKR
jgi:hypothetical protein